MGRRRTFRSVRGEVPGFEADPAVEQLYDELLARTRILAVVVPSLDDSMSSSRTLQRLAGYAGTTVARIRADPEVTSRGELVRLLWPHGTVPRAEHPWWSTPLGAVITERAAAGAVARDDRTQEAS